MPHELIDFAFLSFLRAAYSGVLALGVLGIATILVFGLMVGVVFTFIGRHVWSRFFTRLSPACARAGPGRPKGSKNKVL